ncbi:MAG: CHAT domain-containing protein [Synechococcales bacterium]|nr:CHAT domain-containing protein [Synechococcales bacterium]
MKPRRPFHQLLLFVGCFMVGLGLALLLNLGQAASIPVAGDRPPALAQIHNAGGTIAPPDTLVQQGREAYQTGQFAQAVTLWQQAAAAYQAQPDSLNQALVFSYLASAYQQLGAWTDAREAIATSFNLLHQQQIPSNPRVPAQQRWVWAQALNTQGSLQFAQGNAAQALESWQQAATIYGQLDDATRRNGSLLNQAQAQQSLGLYLQARRTLTEVERSLQDQPDPSMKAMGLQALANVLRTVGALEESQRLLQESLAIAEPFNSTAILSTVLLSAGNTAQAQGDTAAALDFYQRSGAIAPSPLTQLQAQLNQLGVLMQTGQWTEAQSLLPPITDQIQTLPLSRDTVYATINFAQHLTKMGDRPQSSVPANASSFYPQAAQLLAATVQQTRQLGDPRAEAYALGHLGQVYEKTRQWEDARTLTQEALLMAQSINAADVAYQWQWQLGRILQAQNRREASLVAYRAAFDTLQSIRRDLVATSTDLQFSFRESVEPVYREYVDLLLRRSPDDAQPSPTSPDDLKTARDVIEALQVAELDNFFRTACLDEQRIAIDQVNQANTAVIYPIILRDRLEILLSLPQQPIRQYTSPVSEETITTTVNQLREQLARPLTSQEGQQLGQQIYDWLIHPLLTDLEASETRTLVFVLDGALRTVPMATLYDGDRYLIEQYSLALAPGLQLLSPQPLSQIQLKVLAAGLTEERSGFSALVNVESELNAIQTQLPSQILLNEAFTSSALQSQIDALPFPIVHLATHGQFSSRSDATFILAWDRPINVTELSSLLRTSDDTRLTPIELLVLSACETAAGDTRATLGLAGIAIQAGARSTLASLWALNDESAARFISQFYSELTDASISKAEALQRAQVALLRDPNYRSPLFWAPYVLIGNWL